MHLSLSVNDSGCSALTFCLSVWIPAGWREMRQQTHSAAVGFYWFILNSNHPTGVLTCLSISGSSSGLFYFFCVETSHPVYCNRGELGWRLSWDVVKPAPRESSRLPGRVLTGLHRLGFHGDVDSIWFIQGELWSRCDVACKQPILSDHQDGDWSGEVHVGKHTRQKEKASEL